MLLPYRTMDAGCTTHSQLLLTEREVLLRNSNGFYIRSMSSGGGEEKLVPFRKIRREQRYIEMPDRKNNSPEDSLSELRRFLSSLLPRAIFSPVYSRQPGVINKVNSAPLVSRQKTILARPKPRSNAPTDVSRPLNTINQPYSKRRKMRQRDTGGGERETRRDIRARRHVEWVSSVGQRAYHRPVESIYASRDEAYRGRSILDPFAQGVNPRGNWKLYGNEVLPSAGRNARRVGEQKDNTILLAGEFNRQMQAANDDEDDELVAACTGTGACTDTGGGDKQPHNVHAHCSFG